ncbi:MAG: hypothetical protein UY89_C0013G0017 [Parcubacteria group bacterium GW2011_GWA1_54_9]|nr:MAG: hypothetical protein UY89_C0013G0017 [Parcubacteria group bacterium GW2011_GWA1_54_9]KKW41794.1 MAG: hypothetical protein UY91_C0011G0018 [Parcubacteria group bacterium GW2011_GWB1_55_9]
MNSVPRYPMRGRLYFFNAMIMTWDKLIIVLKKPVQNAYT